MEGEVSTELSPTVHHAIAFVYIVLALASFLLNSIILLTFYMDHSLLFPTTMLVLSIAISDWLMGVVVNPMGGAANVSEGGSFGDASCKFYAFVCTFLGLGTMLHHAVIAVEGYLAISRPMEAQNSSDRMLAVIGALWAFAFTWSVFPLLGWSAYVAEAGDIACSLRWQSTRSADTAYIICLFVFFYFGPLLIILYCYTLVFLNMRYMTRNAEKLWGANAAATVETIQASWKMAKIALVMVIGFFFAWTPYAGVSLYTTFGFAEDIPTLLAAFPSMLAKTSNFYNPIIYFFLYRSFRESLMKSWRRFRNRNVVMPFDQSSHSAFVINSRTSRFINDSTSVEMIPLNSAQV